MRKTRGAVSSREGILHKVYHEWAFDIKTLHLGELLGNHVGRSTTGEGKVGEGFRK